MTVSPADSLSGFTNAVGDMNMRNLFPAKMLGYVVASQVIKNLVLIDTSAGEINPRLHFNWFQDAQTGKDNTCDFYVKLAKVCGLEVERIAMITDAGLIGSIDPEKMNILRRKESKNLNRSVESQEVTPDKIKAEKDATFPIVYGSAKNADIIYYPEATKLYDEGEYSRGQLTNWQMIMDEYGMIEKKLGSYEKPIKYFTTTSLIGTSYYLNKVSDVALKTGFFQRTVAYFKSFTTEEKQTMVDEIREQGKMNTKKGKGLAENKRVVMEKMELCAEAFKRMRVELEKKMKAKGGKIVVTADDRYFKYEQAVIDKIRKDGAMFISNEEKMLSSFEMGMMKTMMKIAGINAVLNGRTVINHEDGHVAMKIMFVFIESMTIELVGRLKYSDEKVEMLWKELTMGAKPTFKDNTLYGEKELFVTLAKRRDVMCIGVACSLAQQFVRLGFMRRYHNSNESIGGMGDKFYVTRGSVKYDESTFLSKMTVGPMTNEEIEQLTLEKEEKDYRATMDVEPPKFAEDEDEEE